MRAWCWIAAVIMSLAYSVGQAATQERLDWGMRAVRVDQALPMPGDVPSQPGVLFADIGVDESTYFVYRYISNSGWREGQSAALGLLDGEFGSKEWVEATAFGREGNQIRLDLVYHPRGGQPAQKNLLDRKKRITFGAVFPRDLPQGEYGFKFELKDEQGQPRQAGEGRFTRKAMGNPLAALDDAALMKEYIRHGEILKETNMRPADGGPLMQAMIGYEDPRYRDYERVEHEIISRGARMMPLLIELLRTEAVRNPGVQGTHPEQYGLSYDVMGMMMRGSPDPRPVPLLVEIVGGMNGQANIAVRLQALTTLEVMTYASFGHHWSGAPDSRAVRHAGAVSFQNPGKPGFDAALKKVAPLFAQWLALEGKDSSKWLSIAQHRARELMDGGDEELILNGIAFLQGNGAIGAHDDDPKRTMDRIAALVRANGERYWYWLPKYGPMARPHVDLLLAKAGPAEQKWSRIQALADVGGEKAMQRLVDEVKETGQEMRRLGVDPAAEWTRLSDRDEQNAALAYRICRWGISRWAGRTFADDDAIRQWWAKSKERTQRQWLEEDLDRTAIEADSANAEAQCLLRLLIPDLPHEGEDLHFNRPGRWTSYYFRERPTAPFRVAWLKEHRAALVYDEQRGAFVLGK